MSDLSPKEVVAALGLSRSGVYRLIEDGELRGRTVRSRLRVEPAEVRALKERHRVNPRWRPGHRSTSHWVCSHRAGLHECR
jgi:excisionase family DNA binding protein